MKPISKYILLALSALIFVVLMSVQMCVFMLNVFN